MKKPGLRVRGLRGAGQRHWWAGFDLGEQDAPLVPFCLIPSEPRASEGRAGAGRMGQQVPCTELNALKLCHYLWAPEWNDFSGGRPVD